VDGGQRAGMPGIEQLQKIEGLAPANLPELRNGYLCGWCEIDKGKLVVVPHPQSRQSVRQFAHPSQAEIVGRVTGVAMRIVEDEDAQGGAVLR
jgi:hypothetical protein